MLLLIHKKVLFRSLAKLSLAETTMWLITSCSVGFSMYPELQQTLDNIIQLLIPAQPSSKCVGTFTRLNVLLVAMAYWNLSKVESCLFYDIDNDGHLISVRRQYSMVFCR